MVITKEELQVDKIEGKFEVQIGPEGKKGCSKIIDLGMFIAQVKMYIISNYNRLFKINPHT